MEAKRAIYLQPALDVLVGLDRHNPRRGKKLKALKLTRTQWDMLRQLEPILSVRHSRSHHHAPLADQLGHM